MPVEGKPIKNSVTQQAYFPDFSLISNKNYSENCCSNKPIYEITYTLGTKWIVCFECMEVECFNSDIKEKVRIRT